MKPNCVCIQGKYVPAENLERLRVFKELNGRLNTVYLRLLLKEKPAKCPVLCEVKKMLETAREFKRYACVEKESWKRDYWTDFISEVSSGRDYGKGLLELIAHQGFKNSSCYNFKLLVTQSQLERTEVFIVECERRITELERAERERVALLNQARASQQIPSLDNVDQELAANLLRALRPVSEEAVYIYFKCWSMPDGTNWYKVGITNDLSRREKEQNVLPVLSVTICSVDLASAERARKADAKIHQALKKYKIDNAGNRELFELSEEQAAAVKMAIQALETRSD